ncbi:MAG: LysR family transcriptional regulator [Clostridia bacterium]|nr:LysR family transcriptional regulator [Clostridia bacterium]
MNTIVLKYIVEVEKEGSISKAAENLYMNQPYLSKCIRELEESVGITIFRRTSKGVIPTQKGLEFIACAKDVLAQVEEMETLFNKNTAKKQLFDIVVPRAGYISKVYTEFLNEADLADSLLFDYRETNSVRAIKNVARGENTLGIIRYQTTFESYFMQLLEEQEIKSVPLWEFEYGIIMSCNNPYAKEERVSIDELTDCIRITHGDLSIPSMPISKVRQIKKISQSKKEIAVYDRASQYEILSAVPNSYMLVSDVPDDLLERYGLVYRKCDISSNTYKDLLIYREGYKLTKLDRQFLSLLQKRIDQLKSKEAFNK